MVDGAIDLLSEEEKPRKVAVLRRTGGDIHWEPERDQWLHHLQGRANSPYDHFSSSAISPSSLSSESDCEYSPCVPEIMQASDPLFILYTSGSTGKPKGVVHGIAGYLLQASMTHEHVFDHKEGDTFFCTADCGWITGHTYTVCE